MFNYRLRILKRFLSIIWSQVQFHKTCILDAFPARIDANGSLHQFQLGRKVTQHLTHCTVIHYGLKQLPRYTGNRSEIQGMLTELASEVMLYFYLLIAKHTQWVRAEVVQKSELTAVE